MIEMNWMGRLFIFLGVFLIILGVLFSLAGKVPWIGKLPGDLCVQKRNFTFYFPLTTSILLSAIASLILYLTKHR